MTAALLFLRTQQVQVRKRGGRTRMTRRFAAIERRHRRTTFFLCVKFEKLNRFPKWPTSQGHRLIHSHSRAAGRRGAAVKEKKDKYSGRKKSTAPPSPLFAQQNYRFPLCLVSGFTADFNDTLSSA